MQSSDLQSPNTYTYSHTNSSFSRSINISNSLQPSSRLSLQSASMGPHIEVVCLLQAAEIERLFADLSRHTSKNEQLEIQRLRERSQYQDRIQQLSNLMNQSLHDNSSPQPQKHAIDPSLESVHQELELKYQRALYQIDALYDQNTSLQHKIQGLESKLQETSILREQLETSRHTELENFKKIEQMSQSTEVAEKKQEIRRLRDSLFVVTKQKEAYSTEVAQLTSKLKELKNIEKQNIELEDKVALFSQEIERMTKMRNEKKKEAEQRLGMYRELEAEYSRLKTEYDSSTVRMSSSFSMSDQRSRQLSETLEVRNQEIRECLQAKKEMGSRLRELESERLNEKMELAHLKDHNSKLELEIHHLKLELENVLGASNDRRQQADEATSHYQFTIQELQNRLLVLEQVERQSKESSRSWENKCADLERYIESLKSNSHQSNVQLTQENRGLRLTINDLEAKLRDLESTKEQDVTHLRTKIQEITHQHAVFRQEFEDYYKNYVAQLQTEKEQQLQAQDHNYNQLSMQYDGMLTKLNQQLQEALEHSQKLENLCRDKDVSLQGLQQRLHEKGLEMNEMQQQHRNAMQALEFAKNAETMQIEQQLREIQENSSLRESSVMEALNCRQKTISQLQKLLKSKAEEHQIRQSRHLESFELEKSRYLQAEEEYVLNKRKLEAVQIEYEFNTKELSSRLAISQQEYTNLKDQHLQLEATLSELAHKRHKELTDRDAAILQVEEQVDKLKGELINREERISFLQFELSKSREQLEKNLQQQAQQVQRAEGELMSRQQQIQHLNEQVSMLTRTASQQFQQLEGRFNSVCSENRTLANHNEQLRREIAEMGRCHGQELERRAQQYSRIENQVGMQLAKTQEKVSSVQQQYLDIKRQYTQIEDELKHLHEQLSIAESHNQECHMEIERLHQFELDPRERQISACREHIEHLQNQLFAEAKKHTEAQVHIQKLTTDTETQSGELQRLIEETERLSQDRSRLNGEVKKLSMEIQRLNGELGRLNAEVESRARDNDRVQEDSRRQISELQHALQIKLQEINKLNVQLAASETHFKSEKQHKEGLEQQNHALSINVRDMEHHNTVLSQKIQQHYRQNEQLSLEIQRLETACAQANQHLQEQEQRMASMSEGYHQEVQRIRTEHIKIQEQSRAQDQAHSLLTQLTHTQQQLHSNEQQLQTALSKLRIVEQQLQTTLEKLHINQQQIHRTQKQLQSQEHQLHTTEQQFHRTQEQLHRAQQELHITQEKLQITEQQSQSVVQKFRISEQQLCDTASRLQMIEQQLHSTQQRLHINQQQLEESGKRLKDHQHLREIEELNLKIEFQRKVSRQLNVEMVKVKQYYESVLSRINLVVSDNERQYTKILQYLEDLIGLSNQSRTRVSHIYDMQVEDRNSRAASESPASNLQYLEQTLAAIRSSIELNNQEFRSSLGSIFNTTDNIYSKLCHELADEREAKNSMVARNQELANKMGSLQLQLREAVQDSKLNAIKTQNSIQQEIMQYQASLKKLHNELQRSNIEKDQMRRQFAHVEEALAGLPELQHKLSEYEGIIREREARSSTDQSTIRELTEKIAALQNQSHRESLLTLKQQELEFHIKELSDQIQRVQRVVENKDRDLQELEQTLQKERAAFRQERQQFQRQPTGSNGCSLEMEMQVIDLKEKVLNLKELNNHLEQRVARGEHKISTLTREITQLAESYHKNIHYCKELEAKLNDLHRTNEACLRQIETSAKAGHELGLEQAEGNNNKLQKRYRLCELRIMELELEHEKMREKAGRLERDSIKSKKEAYEMHLELEKVGYLNKKIRILNTEVDRLEELNFDLKDQLSECRLLMAGDSALEKRYEEIMAVMVLQTVEIEALRTQLTHINSTHSHAKLRGEIQNAQKQSLKVGADNEHMRAKKLSMSHMSSELLSRIDRQQEPSMETINVHESHQHVIPERTLRGINY